MALDINQYSYDYFSGSQVSVYIKDIWLDDVFFIQYQVNDSKSPVYGYASQLYDQMLPGRQIVSGVFMIAFKESAYLPIIVDAAYEDGDALSLTGESFRRGIESLAKKTEGLNQAVFSTSNFSTLKGKEAVRNKRKREIISYLGSLSYKGFAEQKKVLEEVYWPGLANKDSSEGLTKPYNYGDQLDIYIAYGNPESSSFTSKKINNISITGESQQIDISGEPVAQAFPFIARSVD
jgi:hypothetical protein